ncbi:uncharacterized protein LOC132401240 isoform X1 [Hypanus sabinus]|uniref:uncharacterized protein LOC132401240 isoform X1 n=2 Tax=Hypanus sabinus TaxID=79690 RepID=UPI0028C43450|nr:uncharacterized protein LOC132401240 isoform X1 [Hypanus sabinus]XP_059839221.1 uncharacterized protein LOC132401240 isoform X1 [Hypanus sabinus]XP_059839222.1 uncharacterized protein LOC132401240 isoform X1 [Hypanus sabinus]
MLSALVGGGVSRGQQLQTSEAASFLLAQELCIRLRNRRVTRVPVPNRPSQPQAVLHGERDRQVSMSEAASHLLTQELQVKRVTRTSTQNKPPDPSSNTHNLKSSGRAVRKLNYRRVANLGLVSSPDAGNRRRSTKPRKSELPATGEGRTEYRFNQKKQASARWSREVGAEQRRRAGAVGKSDAVGRQSKPQSVVYPGSNQADAEVAPETWSSTVTEVPLKAEIPQVHVQPCVHPGGLSGEDDSNRRTAPAIDESRRGVMDSYEGRGPTADVHCETPCSSPPGSAERLFTPLVKEMCTENGPSSDTSERNICPKIPQCEAQAMHVGVEKARGVVGKGNSGGENLKKVVIPFPSVAASEKCLGIGSVHKVPLRGIATSDVPDWVPSDPIATNDLPRGNDGTGVLACRGTLTQNGLPSSKAPVEGEAISDTLAQRRLPSKVLEGEMARQHVGKDQPAEQSVDTAGDEATAAPSGVTATTGATKNALIKTPSEIKGGKVTLAMTNEDVSASEISAGNQRVPDMLAGKKTFTEWTTFGLSTQDELAVPTITMPTHFTSENTIKPVSSGVVAAGFLFPKSTMAKVSPEVSEDVIVESESPVTNVLFGKSQLTDVSPSPTPTAIMEASTPVELTAGVFYGLAADGEHELADIPTDVTGFATEIYTESDQAVEESVLADKALGHGLQPGGVHEAAEATFRFEGVEYEAFADDELVDIPTDVISDVTEKEAEYKVQPLGMTTASNEMLGNRYFPQIPDSIANNILGSAKATSSRDVFSVSEFCNLSLESSAHQEDENAYAEGVVSCSLTEEKLLYNMVDVESERMATEEQFRKGFKGRVETQMSGEVCSVPASQSKECKMSASKERDVSAHSGHDAVCCEANDQRAAELECVPRPVSSTAQTLWFELETASIPNRCDQQSIEGKCELDECSAVLVNNAAALPSVFRCRNKRRGFTRLKRRKLNSPVLFSNCVPSVSTLGKFCLSRAPAVVQICRGVANCINADLYHSVRHVEEIKPKNLSLLPLNDLAPHKLSKKPLLVEHLEAIASGLGVFPSCSEIQQEFTALSRLKSVGVNGRLQTKRIKELQFDFGQQANFWGVLCHLTPRKDQSLHAGACRRAQSWLSSRHCKQSLHFSCPVLSNLDLFLLLSFISDGARVDWHCVSERTDLSIISQYWSQDWQTLPQCPPDCGQGFWPPPSLVRAGRCCCARSRFGLHTVLALLSPACYRLWTRQRHFGRLSSAHRPLLTLFEEGVKRLIPLIPLNKPSWPPSCNVAGLVSCSQHIPSTCTSTSNASPSDSWRHGRLANRPSSLPPCLRTGNTASLTEAKSLRLQLANKRSLLQHLSLSCILEPVFALPDAPTSSAACTVAESTFPSASSPIPSITYMETQQHTEQKEHPASTIKAVSKSKESLRKVSQIRIRKTIPKQDTNLTPMGLPKPKRLKKKEFSLEEIYTNQNYKSPSAHSKYLETIYEEPVLKKGSFVCTSLQKRKRLLEFQDYTLPRKRRAHAGVKVASRTRGRKASTREEEIDSLLVQKLTELEADLAGEDEGH